MDLNFTAEEEDFRVMIREWVDTNVPDPFRIGGEGRSTRDVRDTWYKRLAEKGWLCSSWPEEYGGPGWSLAQQYIFHEEVSSFGAPGGDMGVSMIGPMIIEFGSEAQKERFLGPIAAAEEMWCQGYSEPNAGSDLASLALRAELEGDHYVLNGQKIWTSSASDSDMIFILVRTDTTAKKRQAGITFLVSPMDVPGIEIRPIRQITDESHFFETFFTDVKVPVENRIGEENAGWTIGKRVLAHERNAGGSANRFAQTLQRLRETAEKSNGNGEAPIDDPHVRQRLAQANMELDALSALGFRGLTSHFRGETPGSESSIMKLYGSELLQRICDLAMEVQGPASQLWNDPDYAELELGWPKITTWSRAYSIFSGTSEIQRNIISERVLGLPRG